MATQSATSIFIGAGPGGAKPMIQRLLTVLADGEQPTFD